MNLIRDIILVGVLILGAALLLLIFTVGFLTVVQYAFEMAGRY